MGICTEMIESKRVNIGLEKSLILTLTRVYAPSGLPQLVEPCASDHQGGVELETVWSKRGILKELDEAFDVALQSHVRQVGHHVGNDLWCGKESMRVRVRRCASYYHTLSCGKRPRAKQTQLCGLHAQVGSHFIITP